MKRPRILVLCSRFPEPPIGGERLRIFRICSELARHASLDLLTFCETEAERVAKSESGLFDAITRIELNTFGARARALGAVLGNQPLQIAYYKTRLFDTALKAKLNDYDAVLGHLIRMGEYIKNPVPGLVRILEATDAISLNYSRIPLGLQSRSANVLAYRIEKQRLLDYERTLPGKFDVLSFVSPVDVDFLYPSRPANLVVATNGVDPDQFSFSGPGREKRIVFIGNITSEQNFDACVFFARSVLPLLGEFQFDIIGRTPRHKASALARFPRVRVHGEVPSVSIAATGAFAAVCPVRMGAGVQNKVLEYLAMGLPTVSTSIGMEGLNAMHERDLLRADHPEEIAAAVLRLWQDKALSQRLAVCGRDYVVRNHSWTQTLSPLTDAIMSALERRGSNEADGWLKSGRDPMLMPPGLRGSQAG
jgi:glycosyltransferase involved in cell wall biosynthesis